MIDHIAMAYIVVGLGLAIYLAIVYARKSRPAHTTTPCPYCPNPDRDSVFEQWQGCRYDRKADEARGIIGADPPCVCDSYPSKGQLRRLGAAR